MSLKPYWTPKHCTEVFNIMGQNFTTQEINHFMFRSDASWIMMGLSSNLMCFHGVDGVKMPSQVPRWALTFRLCLFFPVRWRAYISKIHYFNKNKHVDVHFNLDIVSKSLPTEVNNSIYPMKLVLRICNPSIIHLLSLPVSMLCREQLGMMSFLPTTAHDVCVAGVSFLFLISLSFSLPRPPFIVF